MYTYTRGWHSHLLAIVYTNERTHRTVRFPVHVIQTQLYQFVALRHYSGQTRRWRYLKVARLARVHGVFPSDFDGPVATWGIYEGS